MRGLLAPFGAAVFVLASALPASAAPPLTVPIVACPGATVTGFVDTYPGSDATGQMRQFLGIRYAVPPLTTNRWMPPKPMTCWTGDRLMNTFSKSCPQGPTLDPWEGEDCLTLNVFTRNTDPMNRLPVMVFIHGGGLAAGLGSGREYNPYPLVQKGVVVVTINYRLGALGFLTSNSLGYKTGNFGILDQQEALRWVRRNIVRFGGDPANITIFGQSAGGLSVLVQLVSTAPQTTNLFHKAIIESGAFYDRATPLAEARTKGDAFLRSLNCTTSACQRTKPVGAILAAQNPAGQNPPLGQSVALVTQDNIVLKNTLQKLLETGKFKKVPTIVGSAHDETRFHIAGNTRIGTGTPCNFISNITPGNYQSSLQMTGTPQSFVGQLALAYPAGSTPKSANIAFAQQSTDANYACRTLRTNRWMAQNGGTNFAYEFNDAAAPHYLWSPFKLKDGSTFPYGAYHGAELPYLFLHGTKDSCGANIPAMTSVQKQLAAKMVTYWTTFAKTGNPNPVPAQPGLPAWPEFTATATGNFISFEGKTPRLLKASAFDTNHKCTSFWNGKAP
jgi:para-nitrobenzyl esterase